MCFLDFFWGGGGGGGGGGGVHKDFSGYTLFKNSVLNLEQKGDVVWKVEGHVFCCTCVKCLSLSSNMSLAYIRVLI